MGSLTLVSHRAKGFGPVENTGAGLQAALVAGVRQIEMDIRVTKDGVLIMSHDPEIVCVDGSRVLIKDHTSSELSKLNVEHPVETFENVVEIFAAHSIEQSRLYIDAKDGGCEQAILDLCDRCGISEKIIIVSWMPSVLNAFHQLRPELPLCFSYVPLNRFPGLYSLSPRKLTTPGTYGYWVMKRVPGMGKRFVTDAPTIALYYDDHGVPDLEPDASKKVGYNHIHITPGMLSGYILEVLKASGGTVCIPKAYLTRSLVNAYQEYGIKVAAFSLQTAKEIKQFGERLGVDAIYTSNAELLTGQFELN